MHFDGDFGIVFDMKVLMNGAKNLGELGGLKKVRCPSPEMNLADRRLFYGKTGAYEFDFANKVLNIVCRTCAILTDNSHTTAKVAKTLTKRDVKIKRKRFVRLKTAQTMLKILRAYVFSPFWYRGVAGITRSSHVVFFKKLFEFHAFFYTCWRLSFNSNFKNLFF